jgi:hypothetical protein
MPRGRAPPSSNAMKKPGIDRKELGEIVAEAARIEARQSELLDPAEAAEILRELDVSAEHLPEAQQAVAERRLARARARRRYLIAGLSALTASLVGAAVLWSGRSQSRALDAVGVSSAQVERDDQPVAGPIGHDPSVRLSFEVVLEHPPEGAVLDLSCRWRDPAGSERYVNRWSTKPIEHDQWPTRCRHEFDARDARGTWSVSMSLGDRSLSSAHFELK